MIHWKLLPTNCYFCNKLLSKKIIDHLRIIECLNIECKILHLSRLYIQQEFYFDIIFEECRVTYYNEDLCFSIMYPFNSSKVMLIPIFDINFRQPKDIFNKIKLSLVYI